MRAARLMLAGQPPPADDPFDGLSPQVNHICSASPFSAGRQDKGCLENAGLANAPLPKIPMRKLSTMFCLMKCLKFTLVSRYLKTCSPAEHGKIFRIMRGLKREQGPVFIELSNPVVNLSPKLLRSIAAVIVCLTIKLFFLHHPGAKLSYPGSCSKKCDKIHCDTVILVESAEMDTTLTHCDRIVMLTGNSTICGQSNKWRNFLRSI